MTTRWPLRPFLACGTALLAGCSGSSASPSHPAPSPPRNASAVSATSLGGYRPASPWSEQTISYHGVEISVPAWLPITGVTCGLPTRSMVIVVDGREPNCPAEDGAARPQTGLTVIELSPLYPPAAPAALGEQRLAISPASVTGAPADIGYETDVLGATGALVVPSVQVVVTASTPTHTETAELLATTRIAPIEQNGCPAHLASMLLTGNAPSPQLVPGSPISATACAYGTGNYYASFNQWLLRSGRLNASAARRAAADIDAMPPGPQNTGPLPGIHARVVFAYADGTHRTIDTIVYTFGDAPLTTDGIDVVQGSDPTIADALGYA